MKLYIGKTGHLNKLLIEQKNFSFDSIISARQFETENINLSLYSSLCWGGRYAPNIKTINSLKTLNCIYISTYMYNDFYDHYQSMKLQSETLLSISNWKIIRVPFINDLLPARVKKLILRKSSIKSNFYIYITDKEKILESINQGHELNIEKKIITLYLREKIIWFLFSKIYKIPQAIPKNSRKYIYITIKIMEKIVLKIFFTHNLSSVYIGREKQVL